MPVFTAEERPMSKSSGTYGRRGKLTIVGKCVRGVAPTFGKVRHLTFSSKCCGELVVESDAERLVAHMLTLDPRVEGFITQPFTVDLLDQRLIKTPDEFAMARKKHSQRAGPKFYTPDFLITWKNKTRTALEVKLEGFEGDGLYQDRLRLGSSILEAHGHSFAIVVIPANPRHPLRGNLPLLKMASSRLDLWPNDILVQELTEICSQKPVLLKELCVTLDISPNLVPALLVSGCVASNLTEQSLNGTMLLSAAYGDLRHLELLEQFQA